MNLTLAIGPLVALIAGILILIVPRLLNFIVAIYLIIIGLLGLFGEPHQPALGPRAGAARSKRSSSAQVAPLAGRQRAERDGADAHALQAEHLQRRPPRTCGGSAASCLRRRTKRSWSSLAHSTRAGRSASAVELEPVAQQGQRLGRERRAAARRDAHEVLLLDRAVLADQLARDAAVLRQHEQADRVDVEPAGRDEAPQVLRREAKPRAVLAPLSLGVTSTRAGW